MADMESQRIPYDPSIRAEHGQDLSDRAYVPLALRKALGQSFVYFADLPVGLRSSSDVLPTVEWDQTIREEIQRRRDSNQSANHLV